MTLVHHERRGGGSPLLLLHATLSSSRQLRALATRLASSHTVVSVDRRGSGRSVFEGPAGPLDVATHVEDVAEILAAEGLGPVAVVGHSYGGCIALELAVRRPELVRALFVYEPPYAQVASPAVREGIAEIGRRTLAARDADGLAAAALAFMEGVSGAPAVAALSPAGRAQVERGGQGAVADATLRGMRPDALDRISCPVRVVTGDASAAAYADIAAALVQRIPDAEHVSLSGLDHMAPVLQPDRVAASIFEFLAA